MLPPFFTLTRVAVLPQGAFGVLSHIGIPFAVTLEHTYEQPAEPVLKIPPGEHKCTRTRFMRGGYDTYEVRVSGHSRLLFHHGNFEEDSEGCILVARCYDEFGPTFGSRPGISASAAGFARFMELAADAPEFTLAVA